MVMFGLLSVVIAIVLFMFMQNITIPVSKMVNIAKHINEGDLSQSIELDKNDEISEVGNAINELTSNLQEVASFTSLTASEAIEKIQLLKAGNIDKTDENRIINEIEQNMKSLNNFVNTFNLLKTEVKNV